MKAISMHLNREKLFNRCMKNDVFVRQILSIFIDDAPKTVKALGDSLKAQASNDARRFAHNLKGSAGNLAMPSLVDLAKEIEDRIQNDDLVAAGITLREIETELDACLTEADQYRSELGTG